MQLNQILVCETVFILCYVICLIACFSLVEVTFIHVIQPSFVAWKLFLKAKEKDFPKTLICVAYIRTVVSIL